MQEIVRQAEYYGLPTPQGAPAPAPEKVADLLKAPTPWSGPTKIATQACKGCGKAIDPLDEFPGGKCLDCHAADPAVKHRNDNMTAEELAHMWGGK